VLRYAITNGQTNLDALIARCTALARDGVAYVLVREKALEAGALVELSRRIVEAVRAGGSETKVLVAGRVDVAIAAGADGVNLSARQGELTVAQVRRLMPNGYVSVSCHTLAEVRRAREGGANAVLFGPVFGKTVDGVEVVAGVGLEKLREACVAAGSMAVFALGGVTKQNAAACKAAGAAGVAGIRMFEG
jgi:thiamine-phosphate pyrophosphorylase